MAKRILCSVFTIMLFFLLACSSNNSNDPPTISDIPDQATNVNTAANIISFTVDDPDGDALTISGSSSNPEIVPNENIVFGGSGSNRTVMVTPAENSYGTAIITVMVSDGDDTVSSIFELAVIQLTGRISFRSTRNGNTDLYVMNADGTGQTQVTDDEFYDGNQAWSPDGQRIVYASMRDGNGQIFIMNADGTNVTQITDNEYSDNDPELSPDGTRIVFASWRNEIWDIYVMNADGSEQTRLTDDDSIEVNPMWSPDGKYIVFQSGRESAEGNVPDIYIMNPDGTGIKRLTTSGGADPDWSPDGTRIAFFRCDDYTQNEHPSSEIYVINVDGTGLTRLTENDTSDRHPAWSLDGMHILFHSNRDGNGEIYVMNTDGSQQIRITNNDVDDIEGDWYPNIIVTTRMTARSGMEETAKDALMELVTETRKEADCLGYDPFQIQVIDAAEYTARFILHETWRDWNAIYAHMATDHFINFWNEASSLFEPVAGTEDQYFEVMTCLPFLNLDLLSSPVTVVTQMTAIEGREEEVKEDLLYLTENSRNEVGSFQYNMYQNMDDPSLFIEDEIWSGPQAILDHFATDYFIYLSEKAPSIMVAVDSLFTPFEVTIASYFAGMPLFLATDITSDADVTLSVALGDVDGDGDLDLVAGNEAQPNRLYLNAGNGVFEEGTDISNDAYGTVYVALGDVDGDGHLDMVAGNYYFMTGGQVNHLYLNNGTADPFYGVTGTDITSDDDETVSIDLGDVDGDGDLDLVVGNGTQTYGVRNRLYLNNGTADPFYGVTGTDITADEDQTYSVVLADVDGDGDLDLVAGNNGVNRLYLNNGTGVFLEGTDISDDDHITQRLEVGDVDGDGDLDLVAGNFMGIDRLYKNDGTGNFTEGTDIGTDVYNTSAVRLGDLDGDGDLDLVASDFGDITIDPYNPEPVPNHLYWNNGTADPFSGVNGLNMTNTFDALVTRSVVLGDVNGDERLDAIAANKYTPNRLYLNNGTAQ